MLQTKTISYGSFEWKNEISNAYVLDLILTEESTDPVANTSEVSFKFQLRSGSSNRFAAYIDCAVTVAGQTFTVNDYHVTAAYNYTYTLLTGSVTVPHNADGTMEIAASASIDTPESNPYAPPDLSFGDTMVLTPIARASTLASTAASIGAAATVVVSRRSTQYSHSIFYEFGSLCGYFGDAVGTHSDGEVKLTDTTVLFPIPESFYGEIPDSPSGVCTLTCRTYSGDTQIGDAQQTAFTVRADPSVCAPLVSAQVADIHEAALELTGSAQILVQGVSNAQCTVQASAQYGAQLTALTVNGRAVTDGVCMLEGVTTENITVRAVDSRGYETVYTVPGLCLVPYVQPSFHASARRTDPTGGGAVLTVQGKWFSGSFGAVDNAVTAAYQVDGGDWVAFTPETDGSDLTAAVALAGLDYQTSHTVQVQLQDRLHTIQKTATVSKGIPVFDWGENDFAFHVPVRFTATNGTVFTLDLQDGALNIIT